jgi:hypothetical protein
VRVDPEQLKPRAKLSRAINSLARSCFLAASMAERVPATAKDV